MYGKHLEECLADSECPQVLAAAIVVTDHVTSSWLLVCVCAVLWQVTPSSALLLDVFHGIWNALQLKWMLHDSNPCFINMFSLSPAYVSVGTKATQEDLAENYYYFELAD